MRKFRLRRLTKTATRNRTLFHLLDTETREVIAHFATKEYAWLSAKALSREQHRPLSVLFGSSQKPVARFVDGTEIPVTATIHTLKPHYA